MDIGIGLPAAVPGIDGRTLVEWARRAEEFPFTALGTLDRLVHSNWDPLVSLAAAAAVTVRVRLVVGVLLAPLHINTALLAKQALTLDSLSSGRLVLGMGVGIREDDYLASGADYHGRGRAFDRQIQEMRQIWEGAGDIGPEPVRTGGPELLIGGRSDAALRRTARLGCGWVMGAGGPDEFKRCAETLHRFWIDAGRGGRARLQASRRFALGDDAEQTADAALRGYYTFSGPPVTGRATEDAATTPAAVRQAVAAYAMLGCDELIFTPSSADLSQIEMLANAVF